MLKFNFLKFLNFPEKIPILKEFEWFEWFEWFGPSPIEPFNSGRAGAGRRCGRGAALTPLRRRAATGRVPRRHASRETVLILLLLFRDNEISVSPSSKSMAIT